MCPRRSQVPLSFWRSWWRLPQSFTSWWPSCRTTFAALKVHHHCDLFDLCRIPTWSFGHRSGQRMFHFSFLLVRLPLRSAAAFGHWRLQEKGSLLRSDDWCLLASVSSHRPPNRVLPPHWVSHTRFSSASAPGRICFLLLRCLDDFSAVQEWTLGLSHPGSLSLARTAAPLSVLDLSRSFSLFKTCRLEASIKCLGPKRLGPLHLMMMEVSCQ